MIIQGVSFYRLVKWVDSACIAILILTFFSPIAFFFSTRSPQEGDREFARVNLEQKKSDSFDSELIGTGALAIEGDLGGFTLPNLKRELLFISKGSRPDQKEIHFLFGLRSSFDKRESLLGEKHYLTYGAGGELLFSDRPTPLFVEPFFDDKGLCMRVSLLIRAGEQVVVDESSEFAVRAADKDLAARFLGEGIFGRPFVAMEEAEFLGHDQLFVLYGGDEYHDKADSVRLLLKEGKSFSILYVKRGDSLYFHEGRWNKSEGQTKNHFLAKVLTTSPQKVDVEIWDEKGLVKRTVSVKPKRSRLASFDPTKVFSQIRPRTATTISLKIAGENDHLKKGDWLLKEEGKWQLLESWEDVERYLFFKSKGELFVFDGIKKEGSVQYFSGHYFDPLRERCEAISLPISAKEKRVKKKDFSMRSAFPSSSLDDEDDELDLDDDLPTVSKRDFRRREGFAR